MAKAPFPTKQELLQVIAEQKDAFDDPGLRYEPPWMQDAADDHYKAFRESKRLESRLKTRLGQATSKFEQDFDISS